MNKELDRLNIRILKVDKIALTKLAKAEGETMSVLIRRLIRHEIEKERNKENEQYSNE